MNNPIIVANWKCNPENMRSALRLIENTENLLNKNKYKYYIAAPDSMIYQLREYDIIATIGAQNVDHLEGGAYTGQSRLSQVVDAGAQFTILGHSEVRARGESEELIAEKVAQAINGDMKVILCIGEKVRDDKGSYIEEISRQLKSGISKLNFDNLRRLVVAYEPVWSIGVNARRLATPAESLEAAIVIRRELASIVGLHNAKQTQIIYGGSVNESDAHLFLSDGGMDGVLVGHASLDSEVFAAIINNCYEVNK